MPRLYMHLLLSMPGSRRAKSVRSGYLKCLMNFDVVALS